VIPEDPVMLLSYVNMQLRDHYFSLEEMCKSLQLDKDKIINCIAGIDYYYNAEQNQFV